MSWLRFLRRARRSSDLARDIQAHLEMETDDYVARGMPLEEAKHAARRKLGNLSLIREEVYRMSSFTHIETVWQDVAYGLRQMCKRPSFTATVVITLALGIGANAVIFSVIQAVFLQPLPYKDPSRLVAIWDRNVRESGVSKMFASFQDFRDVAQHSKSLEQVAVATWAVGGSLLTGHGPTQSVLAMPVSESFFSLLGVAPARGRTFLPEDLTRGCSVVLSDRLWRSSLGGDPKVVGQAIRLDSQNCAVVGIMPPQFAFYPAATSLWTLLTPTFSPPSEKLPLGIFARLKPGITSTQAEAELVMLHKAVHANDSKERYLVPFVHNLQQEFTFLAEAGLSDTLWVLFGAVFFVLLIACINVANLLLGQALHRERELAVRTALGGGRTRLLRQLLTESLLFAVAGAALGVGISFGGVHYFRAANPVEMPIGAHVEISLPVLVFTTMISIATAILCGLLPAWKASRLDAGEALKSGSRGSIAVIPQSLVQGLVTIEVALSLVLLAGASLLIGSILNASSESLGFKPSGLVLAQIALPKQLYLDDAQLLHFYEQIDSRFRDQLAIATNFPPMGVASSVLQISGKPVTSDGERHDVGQETISAGYLKILGVPLLRGRNFDPRDRIGSEPVALINEAVAHEYFAGSDPIGQRIRVGEPSEKNSWRTVIGIVGNQKTSRNYHQIGWVARPQVMQFLFQYPQSSVTIAIRGSAHDLGSGIKQTDGRVVIGNVETMNERLSSLLAYPKFRAFLLGAFASVALLIAAVGLYGVLRHFVAQRTQEIGVRMALGAGARDVLRFVVWQSVRPVLAGLVMGVAGAFLLSRYLVSLLYGVQPTSPKILLISSTLLIGVAALATFFPSKHATSIEPMIALRSE